MGRYSGGYTIIEVMIVIAITGILFASAILVFQGQQGNTEFDQAMQDISSQIQSYASQIDAGTYDGSTGYNCGIVDPNTGQPQLTVANGTGDNSGCVFLGRALQITPGQGTMEAYTVVGSRDSYNVSTCGGDCNVSATSLDQANPTVATVSNGAGGQTFVLEDDYTLEDGAVFTHSRDSSLNEYDLMGMYTNLGATSGSSVDAANNLLLEPYPCNPVGSGGCQPRSTQVINCIEGINGCSAGSPLSQWQVCVQAADGQTGELMVNNSVNGITTQLNLDSCPS